MLKIALLGSSQLSFPGDKKTVYGRSAEKMKALSEKLGFELFVYNDTIITPEDAYAAVKVVEDEKVDFVLLQCTSFSAGHLASIFARVKNAYLGLWAIPEFAKDGVVPFNSLCSINMYSAIIGHYLKDYKVPIKWYYGDVEDALFIDRFKVTVRALKAIKKLKSSNVALIGGVAPGFNDLYDDERNIIKRLDGIRINRLHEYSEVRDRAVKYTQQDIQPYLDALLSETKGVNPKAKDLLEINARFGKAYDDFVAEYKYDALAVSCWPKFQDEFKYSVCSVVAGLNDKGIPTSCEGDLVSAISMLMLKTIADDETMLMDLSAFDTQDDSVLMWHCGPASKRFCSNEGYTLSVNYHGMAHPEGFTEPNSCGVTRDMVFAPDEVTVARLTGECDKMLVVGGKFMGTDKKSFHGSRGWLGNLTLNNESISAKDFLNTILVQRFQHHFPIVKGNFINEVFEVMAWLGLDKVEKVEYKDYMQNPTTW